MWSKSFGNYNIYIYIGTLFFGQPHLQLVFPPFLHGHQLKHSLQSQSRGVLLMPKPDMYVVVHQNSTVLCFSNIIIIIKDQYYIHICIYIEQET